MIQRDIIQRLIHQISAVLARMIGKSAEEQFVILENYFKELNGLSLKDLDEISDDNLLNFLSEDLQMDVFQIEAVAGVLKARGDIFLKQENFETAKTNFYKAIILLDFVNTETATYSFDRNNLIDEITNNLKGFNK